MTGLSICRSWLAVDGGGCRIWEQAGLRGQQRQSLIQRQHGAPMKRMLAAALLLQSDPVLVASAAVMLILGVYELQSGSSVARRHLETINVQQRPPASR